MLKVLNLLVTLSSLNRTGLSWSGGVGLTKSDKVGLPGFVQVGLTDAATHNSSDQIVTHY